MKTVVWMPEGNPTVTQLGLVEVEPGTTLTPGEHETLVAHRLQDLIEQDRLTLTDVEMLIDSALTPEGWQVPVSSLESAPYEILTNLAWKLRGDGALIRETVTIPSELDDSDNRMLAEEVSLEAWLNRASMPPL